MSSDNYTNVNGHTNVFWGWGREDSDIEYRIRKQLKIEKPEVFDSGQRPKCYTFNIAHAKCMTKSLTVREYFRV